MSEAVSQPVAQEQPNAQAATSTTTTQSEAASPAPKAAEATPPAPAQPAEPAAKAPAEAKTEASPAKKTEETQAQKTVVPEKYDLKLPEGSLLDAARIEKISAFAKEKGLSNEQAQSIVDRENDAVAEFVSKQQQELKQNPAAWLKAAEQDKEIGGEHFKENAELAKRVFERHASDALKKMLIDTGLGNHPELVRLGVRLGKAMSEDKLVTPGTQTTGKKAIEDVFYGNSN